MTPAADPMLDLIRALARAAAARRMVVAREGIKDAVHCCFVGSTMHVPGRDPLTLIEMYQEKKK